MTDDRKRFQLLKTVYEATEYWVDDAPGGAFSIHCGKRSPEIDCVLAAMGLCHWIYITACNPGSQLMSDAENARRTRDLEAKLRPLPCVIYQGRGVGAVGDWPPEPSLLVLGLEAWQGLEIAREFGQAAIIVGRCGEPARLVWVAV